MSQDNSKAIVERMWQAEANATMRKMLEKDFEATTKVFVSSGVLHVNFYGLPHLMFKLQDFIALQSWTDYKRYHIEITLRDNAGTTNGSTTVHSEYTEDWKWRVILRKLQERLDACL